MSKETEKRERTKESKDKERAYPCHASARAHARDPQQGLSTTEVRLLRSSPEADDRQLAADYVKTIPSIERAISHAALRHYDDAEFVRSWYMAMEMDAWMNRFGEPIRNWCSVLERWIHNRAYFDKLNDPNRIPDARKSGSGGRKADNWRGTRKEDVGDVLG